MSEEPKVETVKNPLTEKAAAQFQHLYATCAAEGVPPDVLMGTFFASAISIAMRLELSNEQIVFLVSQMVTEVRAQIEEAKAGQTFAVPDDGTPPIG